MKKQTFARLAELCGQAYAGTITPEDMAEGIQKAARLELNFDPAKFGKHLHVEYQRQVANCKAASAGGEK